MINWAKREFILCLKMFSKIPVVDVLVGFLQFRAIAKYWRKEKLHLRSDWLIELLQLFLSQEPWILLASPRPASESMQT